MYLCPNTVFSFIFLIMIVFQSMAVEKAKYNPNSFNTDSGGLIDRCLNDTFNNTEEIIFVSRLGYEDPHWYANIGYYCDDVNEKAYAGNGNTGIGKLFKLNLQSGEYQVILDTKGGAIRDPQVHYDAEKVLFSYRKKNEDYYHLYELNLDGSQLRQITTGEYDDYEPTYLPDGDIIFISTRCQRWVNCWTTQVGVMFRCDGNGQNIRILSSNIEHDNTPWVMPDGRILYTRWEYVDRSQVAYHGLWIMNPDGTNQMTYFGNMHPRIVIIDAKPIPGTDKVVASFSPGHGRKMHAGAPTILSNKNGPDDLSVPKPLTERKNIVDPFPLSSDLFLAASKNQILLMDDQGHLEVIYTHPQNLEEGETFLHEPRPIRTRKREPIIPVKSNPEKATGYLYLEDIYIGRNMQGVKRGEIKKLLILETLPKPVNFSGGADLTSWLGTFTLARVMGTVPVSEDGSAFFEIPANRPVFFVALDKDDLSVKRMQSFTSVMPGEKTGCIGCHENRVRSPLPAIGNVLQSVKQNPSQIKPYKGYPEALDFNRDVQPILDKHCVKCHNYKNPSGHVLLTSDLGPHWSHAYFSLLAHKQVADGHNGHGNKPPRTLGSSASKLMEKIKGSHHNVRVSEREWRTIWLWIESGAPYAGSYAALRNGEDQDRASAAVDVVFKDQQDIFVQRCGTCHEVGSPEIETKMTLPFEPKVRLNSRGLQRKTAFYERVVLDNDPIARFSPNILLNLSHPEDSPLLLAPLSETEGGWGMCPTVFKSKSDSGYCQLLASLQKAKVHIDASPRYATRGFKPNRQYIREMKKFGILSQDFKLDKSDMDIFSLDERYWRYFWYDPRVGENWGPEVRKE